MDAVDFLNSLNRMCEHNRCATCPIELSCPASPDDNDALMAVFTTVEDWAKKHPIITNRQKLKEVFGKSIPNVLLLGESEAIELENWLDAEYKEQEGDK